MTSIGAIYDDPLTGENEVQRCFTGGESRVIARRRHLQLHAAKGKTTRFEKTRNFPLERSCRVVACSPIRAKYTYIAPLLTAIPTHDIAAK